MSFIRIPPEGSQVARGLRHCITVIEESLGEPGSIPGCITSGRDQESHRVAHNWPSIVQVRGGLGRGRPSISFS